MIDAASLYFRVRAIKMDLYDDFDLEWNKEIIYSGRSIEHFAGEPVDMKTLWRVDVIDLATDSVIKEFSNIESREKAERMLSQLKSDLKSLSRLEFVAKHIVIDGDEASSY